MMLSIKDVVPDDLDALTSVFIACFNAPPWNDGWTFDAARERLEAILNGRRFRGAMALLDGNAVAMALGQKERWVDAFHFNLQEMGVVPDGQRKGIGRALLQHITAVLRREGVTKMYLITRPNSAPFAFYSSHGFCASGNLVVMASALKA